MKVCGGQTLYEAKYKSWLDQKHKTTFSKWQWYDNCKSFANILIEYEVLDQFKAFSEDYVDFLEPTMNPWTIIAVCKDVTTFIVEHFGKTLEKLQ